MKLEIYQNLENMSDGIIKAIYNTSSTIGEKV